MSEKHNFAICYKGNVLKKNHSIIFDILIFLLI
jgi:hypothetical protein